MLAVILLCMTWLPLVTSLSQPLITPITPSGVRFEVKDEGYDLVALHYSINTPVAGVQAGQFNFDLNNKEGGKWIHVNNAVTLHPNDVINYWVYALVNGRPQQLLDQSWSMSSGNTPKPTSRPTPRPVTAGNTPKPTPRPTSRPVTNEPTDHHPDNTNTGNKQPIQNSVKSTSTSSQQSSCSNYPCLVFEDNFEDLDVEVWEHELTLGGGGNWEFEHYTNNRSNSYVRNGILYLKPTLTADAHDEAFLEHGTLDIWGAGPYDTCTGNAFYGCSRTGGGDGHILNPIQSAKLRSSRGFNVKYGKVEVEAKLPTGDWIWPAIWMMPTYDAYGSWPTSGEIDIMESRGNVNYKDDKGQPAGVDNVGSTLHFGPNWQQDAWPKATANKHLKSGTFGDRFYRYAVEWDEHSMKFTIDDEVILNVQPDDGGFWKYGGFDKSGMANPWESGNKMAPFDQKFFIILNVAVGGMNYFPDSFHGPRPKPWKEADSKAFWHAKNQWYPTWNPNVRNGEDAAMQINYVKVWKMKA